MELLPDGTLPRPEGRLVDPPVLPFSLSFLRLMSSRLLCRFPLEGDGLRGGLESVLLEDPEGDLNRASSRGKPLPRGLAIFLRTSRRLFQAEERDTLED